MREVASFDDERLARRFADVLCAADIHTNVSETRDGGFSVWVLEEADVEAATNARAAFEAAPDDPAHRAAEGCVERARRRTEEDERRSRHAVIAVRERFRQPGSGPVP